MNKPRANEVVLAAVLIATLCLLVMTMRRVHDLEHRLDLNQAALQGVVDSLVGRHIPLFKPAK